MRVLDVLTADSDLGRVYGALVRQPRSTCDELAAATGLDAAQVLDVLDRLATERLAVRLGVASGAWEAQPPDAAATAFVEAEERRLAAIREQAQRLAEVYWFARREAQQYPGIEVVRDRALIFEQAERIQLEARTEVRWFDCPPYLSASEPDQVRLRQQVALQQRRMGQGIRYRTIYHDSVWEHPSYSTIALDNMAHGEQARTLASLPMKLVIGDDRRAMLPLDPSELHDGATLIVHPSGLLSALVAIFETLWQMAVPISGGDVTSPLGKRDQDILTLMASGATDEVIARRLNLSRRTVVRHSASLLERLGATTRFQAGVQASRLGWL
ncbi:MAG TPA: helix-turn-helix transcriptional regulator [Jatrophihabitantaceae bacterium]